MLLSKRLIEISKYLINFDIYDVGCDHGYLAYYLFENNLINKAVLVDVNEGPLNSAIKLFKGSDYKVDFYLCDGLYKLDSKSNLININGMGSHLIKHILLNEKNNFSNIDRIVLQPNLKPEIIREFIFKIGFKIVKEEVVYDKKYYPILILEKGITNYNYFETLFGKIDNFVINQDMINYYKFLHKNKNLIYDSSKNCNLLQEIKYLDKLIFELEKKFIKL